MERVSSQDAGTTQAALTLGAHSEISKILTNEVNIPTGRGSLHYHVTARHLDIVNGGRYVEGYCYLEFDLIVETWAIRGWLPPRIVKTERKDGWNSWGLGVHGFFIHNGKIVKDRRNHFGVRCALVRHAEEFPSSTCIRHIHGRFSLSDELLDRILSPIEERLLGIYTSSRIVERPSAASVACPIQ